jgi:hypothetical protein
MIVKYLFLIFFSICLLALTTTGRNIVAETVNCERKIQIKAKEGEQNIRAIEGGKETVLFVQGNQVFMLKSPVKLTYDSYNRRSDQHFPRYQYIHPSVAAPKMGVMRIITEDKKVLSCEVKAL